MIELNKIYNQDCLDGLKLIDTNSIDAIVSDPPYQLSSITKRFGSEGSAEAQFGTDGAYQRASKGFMQKAWDVLPTTEILKECIRVLKAGAFALWFQSPRQDSQMEFLFRLREAGFNISFSSLNWIYTSGFPKASNIAKMVDKRMGVKVTSRQEATEGYEPHKPITPEAKALDGAYGGMQLKPAYEPIIVSMKPIAEKTYLDQALKNGHGISWLDKARIPYLPTDKSSVGGNPKGRFPANIIVSDNAIDTGTLIKGQQGRISGDEPSTEVQDDEGDLSHLFSVDAWFEEKLKELPEEVQKIFPFIHAPKASSTERNKGLKEKGTESNIYSKKCLTCGKRNLSGNICHCEKPIWAEPTANKHPTVKPISICSWLITLVSREGDTILDPFAGSGTTGITSYILNRKFIMFEKEKEYFDIAQERLGYYMKQDKLS